MTQTAAGEQDLIGRETVPFATPLAVNEAMARFWCEMVEDDNPIYFDEDYAGSTWLGGTFAPPAMLYTWGRPLLHPAAERESATDKLDLSGYPEAIAVNAVQEYFEPLRYGDRLSVTSKVSSISDEKTTRLGTGRFVISVDTFRRADGAVVGTHTFTIFRYRTGQREGA
jgi:acyl dehydratase